MTDNNSPIVFPLIPPDYPRLIYREIYNLTDKVDVSGNIRCFKKDFTHLSVWHALRSIYIYFKNDNKEYKYKHDFADYKQYDPYEVVEHLCAMLNETEKTAKQKKLNIDGEDSFNWHHLAECLVHYKAYIVLIDSFLEAVQGISFTHRYEARMDQLLAEFASLAGDTIEKSFEELGIKAQEIKFNNAQNQILGHQATIWGGEKTAQFIGKHIIPIIKDDTEVKISTEKLVALIAQFNLEESFQN